MWAKWGYDHCRLGGPLSGDKLRNGYTPRAILGGPHVGEVATGPLPSWGSPMWGGNDGCSIFSNTHLRVQHIPLIHLMGLLKFFERKLLQNFGPLGTAWARRTLRRRHRRCSSGCSWCRRPRQTSSRTARHFCLWGGHNRQRPSVGCSSSSSHRCGHGRRRASGGHREVYRGRGAAFGPSEKIRRRRHPLP